MTYKLFRAYSGSLATSQTFITGNLKKRKKKKERKGVRRKGKQERERKKKEKDEVRLPLTSASAAAFQDLSLFEAEFLPFLQLRISWFLLHNHFKKQGSRLAKLMVPHG